MLYDYCMNIVLILDYLCPTSIIIKGSLLNFVKDQSKVKDVLPTLQEMPYFSDP